MRTYRLLVTLLFLIGCVAGLLLLIGFGGGKGRPDRRTAGILAGATKVEVFRIEGGKDKPLAPIKPGDPTVCGYAILAQGNDQSHEFVTKLSDILNDSKTYTNNFARCFWPGVAFRVWKGEENIDVLICFHCGNFYLGPSTDQCVVENACFRGSPNTGRLIQLAKEAFPNDEEVQAIKE